MGVRQSVLFHQGAVLQAAQIGVDGVNTVEPVHVQLMIRMVASMTVLIAHSLSHADHNLYVDGFDSIDAVHTYLSGLENCTLME